MRVLFTKLCSTMLGLVLSTCGYAQLTGTKNIPGDYSTLALAITDLNTVGVGAGGVTINLLAGNAQTAPVGGFVITATGTAANPIIFQGNANILTAATGLTVGSVSDAIIKIGGGDYITINNFQLRDNVANTVFATAATNTMTEFGIVVGRGTTTDGAKNNTISNCNIQLRQGGAYTNTFGIYSNARHDYNAASYTTAVLNAAGGENSNNTFRNNTISGVSSGIVIIGDATNVDVNNTVGGTSGQGNNITIGPNTAGPLSTFAGYSTGRLDGIFMQNPSTCTVNNNTIVGNTSSISTTGIYLSGTAGSTAYTNTTNNNIITVAASSGTGANYGIWNTAGNTTATQTMNNNTITVSGGGTTYGVYIGAVNSIVNVNSNNLNVSATGGSGTIGYIYNAVALTGTLNIQTNAFSSSAGIASTGTMYLVHNNTNTPNLNMTANVTSGAITRTAASGTMYIYYNFGSPTPAGGLENISDNNFSNMSCTGTSVFYGLRASTLTTQNKTINNNIISNITAGSGVSAALVIDYFNSVSVAMNNKVSNITGTGNIYGISIGSSSTLGAVGQSLAGLFEGNKVTNVTSSGASAIVTGIFVGPQAVGYLRLNADTVLNVSATGTTAPIVRGITIGFGINDTLSNCYINGISAASGGGSPSVSGVAVIGSTTPYVFNNNINGVTTGTSTGATSQAIGVNITSSTTAVNVFNNFVSDIAAPSSANPNAVVGINIANTGTVNNRIFFNTIKLGATGTPLTSTGADFGVAGLLFPTTATVTSNVKNNIFNINATPSGTGVVAAVRRVNTAGVAGVAPLNYSGGSNVYYTNTGANNYLFVEGTLNTNVVNGYAMSGLTANVPNNIVNDANFNTACGLYKTFMGGEENATTSENNLVAGTVTGTFTPSGASFAQNSAIVITTPPITFDNGGAVRSSTPDGGAKEFTGAASDVAAPTIAYTPLTNTFCTSPVSLTATISDGTGVNLTAGTRPRLYFKKSSEANAFGTYPANNVSAFDGWKYVESTNSGTTHTFSFNYSLLTSAIANGDVIEYFVAAQDVVGTPNVGFNTVALATGYCASSVNLPPAAGPVLASPAVNSFTISPIPTFTATASLTDLCQNGSATITLTPAVLGGSTIQWQFDNYVNIYSNIPGANAANYTTPVIIDTAKYRANIYCGATIIATSTVATVNVNNPVIATTVGDTVCPNQAAVLTATSVTGNNFAWYAAPTGGTALATGTTFTTPAISTSTTYYVSASTGANSNVGLPSNSSTYGTYSSSTLTDWPLWFTASTAGVIAEVTVYPTNVGPLSIGLRNQGSATNIATAGPFNFTSGQLNTPVVLTVNIPVTTPGNYQLTNITGGVGRISVYNGTGGGYPFIGQGITVTGSVALSTSTAVTTAYYNSFYNILYQTGCEGGRTSVTAMVTNPPNATLASTNTICQGASGDVEITFTGYGPWDFDYSDGITTGTITGVTSNPYTLNVTPLAPNTSYSLTALSDNICSADPLTLTSSATVNTYAQPSATLGGTQTICEGASTFIALNLTGTGPWSYTLDDGISPVTFATSASSVGIPVSPTATTTYSITAMNDANCSATLADITNDATITVNSRATVAIATVTDTICTSGSADLEFTFTGTGPWFFNYTDGVTPVSVTTSSNPYITAVTPASTNSYYVDYLQDNNCVSLPPDYGGTASVEVVTGPSISTQPSDLNACSNSSGSFSVVAEGWGAMYQWYDGNNVALVDGPIFSGTQTPTLSVSNITGLNGTNYYAVITGNCPTPATTNTVTIVEGFATTWNGGVNSLWSVPQNWSCGTLPNVFTDVTIPASAMNMPEVDFAGAICHSLTVDNGASVTFINAGSELEVIADITNNGVFDGTGGSVVLSGTGAQNIPGAIYDELHVLNGSTKTITGNATINNELELNNGLLEIGNNDVILGAATVTGGSATSYISTTGTGIVKVDNMGTGGNTGAVTFHVGSGSYTPVTLTNAGTADNFSVRVMPNVYVDGDGTSPATVDNAVVNRTWMISEDVDGGSDVTMTPQWNTAEHFNGFDISHVYVAHYTGGEWVNEFGGPSTTAPAAVGTDPYTTTQSGISVFSPFTVASTAGFPLAIKISSISATNVREKNRVNWTSATEATGDKFVVEQSADAKSFIEIGNLNAKGTPSEYIFWDEHPYAGTTYYRVKLLSGSTGVYSRIVYAIMNVTNNFSLSAYPNPVTDKVSIQANGNIVGEASVVITDVAGKVVRSSKLDNGATEISMDDLAAGVYMIRYSDDVNHESIKINKQ